MSNRWITFLVYVLIVGVLFSIGFPLYTAWYIRRHRDDLYSPKLQSRIGFLYGSFTRNSEFWEVHEIIRKMILTGVIIYLQTTPVIQACVAILICLISSSILNYYQPHKNRVLFWLSQISFNITSLKYLSVILLVTSKNSTEADNVGVLLISLDLAFFAGSIIASGIAIYIVWEKIHAISKNNNNERKKVLNSKVYPKTINKNYKHSKRNGEKLDGEEMNSRNHIVAKNVEKNLNKSTSEEKIDRAVRVYSVFPKEKVAAALEKKKLTVEEKAIVLQRLGIVAEKS
jgi:hypothetical protein